MPNNSRVAGGGASGSNNKRAPPNVRTPLEQQQNNVEANSTSECTATANKDSRQNKRITRRKTMRLKEFERQRLKRIRSEAQTEKFQNRVDIARGRYLL
eukprot:scaffold43662_cov18-Prasinocladus_malaysianus.AAC.1